VGLDGVRGEAGAALQDGLAVGAAAARVVQRLLQRAVRQVRPAHAPRAVFRVPGTATRDNNDSQRRRETSFRKKEKKGLREDGNPPTACGYKISERGRGGRKGGARNTPERPASAAVATATSMKRRAVSAMDAVDVRRQATAVNRLKVPLQCGRRRALYNSLSLSQSRFP
jgi:hypothetical protein